MTTTAHEDQFTPAEPTVTLKPCAHCGGEAKLHSYLLDAAVVCIQCGAEMSADHGAKLDDKTGDQLAARAWNTRTASAPADLVEALRWALAEIEGRTRYTDPQQRQNCLDKCEMALAKHGGA